MSQFCSLCRSITLQLKNDTQLTVKRPFAKINDADLRYCTLIVKANPKRLSESANPKGLRARG